MSAGERSRTVRARWAAAVVALALATSCATTTIANPDGAGDPDHGPISNPPIERSSGDRPRTDHSPAAESSPSSGHPPEPERPEPVIALGEPIVIAEEPVDLVSHPVSGELYVVERQGVIRRITDGDLSDPVLDLRDQLVPALEEGALGLAFASDGGAAYVNTASQGRTTIIEVPVDAEETFIATEQRVVLEFDQPYESHNGGEMLIGPDDMLYVFLGDGGFIGDPHRHALDLGSPLGKILRVDPSPDGDQPYTVPADNPYLDDPDALDLVWSAGLRNPWRASFDDLTGDLWITDVGDFGFEEINVAWAGPDGAGHGLSFGWSAYEGFERFNEDQPAEGHTEPFHVYPHGDGWCSIIGGERYRGAAIPELYGWFVYSDFCSQQVMALEVIDDDDPRPGRVVRLGEIPVPVSISADADGELFVVSIAGPIQPIQPIVPE